MQLYCVELVRVDVFQKNASEALNCSGVTKANEPFAEVEIT